MERPQLDALCLLARLPFSPVPALIPPRLYPSLYLLFLAEQPRRNEVFVFREPGQRGNRCKKNLDNA